MIKYCLELYWLMLVSLLPVKVKIQDSTQVIFMGWAVWILITSSWSSRHEPFKKTFTKLLGSLDSSHEKSIFWSSKSETLCQILGLDFPICPKSLPQKGWFLQWPRTWVIGISWVGSPIRTTRRSSWLGIPEREKHGTSSEDFPLPYVIPMYTYIYIYVHSVWGFSPQLWLKYVKMMETRNL